MELLPAPLHLIHLAGLLVLLTPLLVLGLLVAWQRRRLPSRAWVGALALQALLVGDAMAAGRSAPRGEWGAPDSIVAMTRPDAHAASAELFARAVAAVLALAVAAAALGGEAQRSSERSAEPGGGARRSSDRWTPADEGGRASGLPAEPRATARRVVSALARGARRGRRVTARVGGRTYGGIVHPSA